jgi:hypothetical protein
MPMTSAQIAAGIVARFTPHVGGCWKILERRVRVESKLLYENVIVRFHAKFTNIPPLHHDEGEKVHALGFVQQVIRQRCGVIAELAR